MKVVKTGKTYMIYGDDLQTFDNIPAKVYTVECSQMMGFYLKEHAPLEIKEDKIYGVHNEKIAKVLDRFPEFERNLGVILSGHKGIGKSLFAKVLGREAVKRGLPVILVEKYLPGLAGFVQSIEQEAVVIFDEFDKTYGGVKQKSGESDAQSGLLTLFDGMAMGKKMYVITCNELHGLNDYLINRPGRFHYHIRFDYPDSAQVTEYLTDKLKPEFYDEIQNVVLFCKKVKVNYDTLRAIVFELNHGLTFKEAILDLNILNMKEEKYNLTLLMSDGSKVRRNGCCLDLFSGNKNETTTFDVPKFRYADIIIDYKIKDVKEDPNTGAMIILADDLEYEFRDLEDDEKKEVETTDLKPRMLIIERQMERHLHYMV